MLMCYTRPSAATVTALRSPPKTPPPTRRPVPRPINCRPKTAPCARPGTPSVAPNVSTWPALPCAVVRVACKTHRPKRKYINLKKTRVHTHATLCESSRSAFGAIEASDRSRRYKQPKVDHFLYNITTSG